MSYFDYYGIPVRLAEEKQTALISIRDDCSPAGNFVVFADPQKLAVYMRTWTSADEMLGNASKHREAYMCLKDAMTKTGDPAPVCGPKEKAVPMAMVSFTSFDVPAINPAPATIDRIVKLMPATKGFFDSVKARVLRGRREAEIPKGRLDFTDGITRTVELMKAGAAFVPLEVETVDVQKLHNAVGGSIPPRPASDYLVPREVRIRKMEEYRAERLAALNL